MGIYDREYYGDDQRDGLDFFRGDGAAIRTLIFANVLVYIFQIAFRGALEPWFAADSDAIAGGQVWRLFTANFLHDPGNPFHLIFNMLVLWFAGRELEIIYGRQSFYKFYFGACVFAMSVWFLAEKAMHPGGLSRAIGASGAVMASMMLLTMHFPRRSIIFIFIPMELWVLMSIYVVVDFLQLVQESRGIGGGQVAFAGHLGGVLYGYLYKSYDLRVPSLDRFLKARKMKKFKVVGREWPETSGRSAADRSRSDRSRVPTVSVASNPRPAPKASAAGAAAKPVDSFETRVDEILIKIARDGQNSLSDEEKRVLQEASQRAKSRRNGPGR